MEVGIIEKHKPKPIIKQNSKVESKPIVKLEPYAKRLYYKVQSPQGNAYAPKLEKSFKKTSAKTHSSIRESFNNS